MKLFKSAIHVASFCSFSGIKILLHLWWSLCTFFLLRHNGAVRSSRIFSWPIKNTCFFFTIFYLILANTQLDEKDNYTLIYLQEMDKIILFELNEVPIRIINYYCKMRPNSWIAKHIGNYITCSKAVFIETSILANVYHILI